MALFFFCRLEKPWRTIAVLFSSQFFPIPRVVVKKSFSTRKNILFLYFLLSLYVFFPQSKDVLICNAVRQTRRKRKRQRGGIFTLAALIPALVAASKAAALGAVGGAAGYGVKKGLEAATRKKRRKQRGGVLTMPNRSRPRMRRSTGPNMSSYVQ